MDYMDKKFETENIEINVTEFDENGLRKYNSEMKISNQFIMVFSEFIGTAMLVFFGCMGCIDWMNISNLTAPLNFGLVVMFLTQIFGPLSYAVFNPSVTVAATICRIINIKVGIMFLISQLTGAVSGYGLLKILIPKSYISGSDNATGLCVTSVDESITTPQAFLIEFFLTSALILISCSHWDPSNSNFGDSVPLRMGLTVAGLGITGGKLTGASMNPARTFGPALFNWDWRNQWIYWTAPLFSGFLASVLYRTVFWNRNPKEYFIKK